MGNAQVLDISNYSNAECLGKTEFYGMAQDSNLVLYFATDEGIITHNGDNFKQLFISKNIDHTSIKAIFYYNESLLLQDNEGINRYYIQQDSLVPLFKKSVSEIQLVDQSLYFISGKELYGFNIEKNSLHTIYKNDSDLLQAFSIGENDITVGTKKGLYTIKNGEVADSYGSFIDVKSLKQINDSTLLILDKSAVYLYDQNVVVRRVDLKNDVAKNFFYSDLGNIWIATANNKIFQFDGIFLNEISNANGLKPYNVNKIQKDAEGNIWLMGRNGLSKVMQNQPFLQLNQQNVLALFNKENSALLIKQGEFVEYSLSFTPTIYRFNLSDKIRSASSFYADNQWFIIINNKYLYRWNSKDNTAKRTTISIDFQHFTYLNGNGFLALDKEKRLHLLDKDLNISKNFPLESHVKTLISSKNNVYIVHENNEVSVVDSSATLKPTAIKLADTLQVENLRSSSLGLWYFSDTNIKLLQKNGQVIPLNNNLDKELNNSLIFNIYEDSNFNLWLSASNAIIKIRLAKEGNKLITGEVKFYGEHHHIASSYFSNTIELENEQIWFNSQEKITIYNPLLDNPLFVAPGIMIDKARALVYDDFGSPLDTINLLSENLNLSSKNEIWISTLLITHSPSRKSFVEYRNINEGNEWKKLNEEGSIILSNLKAGTNTIEIQAVSAAGLRSNKVEKVKITVNPPFWQRGWFYVTAFLSVILLGFIGFRTINNYKDSRTKELHEKLDKELEDLERKSHLQILKSERLKQLNDLITSQKSELEKKNKQIESQKYELSLTNEQIKKQKDLLEETSSKLKASINYAQRIQNALMSTEVEIKKAIDESFVYFMPRDVVSGDFYWFNKVFNEKGEELLILAAVDCTGHGVPGAIVSVVGINLLNNITKLKKIYKPGDILNELNADIISNLRQNETQVNDGMDMSLVTINKNTRQIEFAGAKNPLMYVENGELIRIRGDKHAIGGQQRGDERNFQTHVIDCSDNIKRSFFLFSDGYQDQFGGEKGFKFLTSNFKELLARIHDEPILEQKSQLYETMENWKGDYPQTDDILIIGFKF
ncbi:hypothetical protein GCM10011506_15210 [Marivirga lumbricoides]|uniref:PPM-type phosphatase domain-containing protein n=2 Tax=Marivirga lumbricoides TaxID=1046115 RepID=A0ABQ1LWC3_9BACT|nr:hypothetical protein GCM10011506_15210 [Marivirga lumbricoides]